MKAHFRAFAAYNRWANERLYAAAAEMPESYRRHDCGAFFGSVHGTLNHILVADVIWLARLRAQAPPPWRLDHEAHADFDDLRAARAALDDDVAACVEETADFDEAFDYRDSSGNPRRLARGTALAHLFNHQTHHRGQCHAMLTRLSGAAPPLDLLYFHQAG